MFVYGDWRLKIHKRGILNKDAVYSFKIGNIPQQFKQVYIRGSS